MGALPSDRHLPPSLANGQNCGSGGDRAGPDGAHKGRAGAGRAAACGHRQRSRHVVGDSLCRTASRGPQIPVSEAG